MNNSEAVAKIDKALATVAKLCEGEIRWTMRIPAEPDNDPDLIIAGALQAAKNALAAAPAQAEPEFWKLVPIEPTEEMQKAWDTAPFNEDLDEEFRGAYRAMIEAAPVAAATPVAVAPQPACDNDHVAHGCEPFAAAAAAPGADDAT